MPQKKRYNIGLITGNVEDDFPNFICKGAMQAAEELDDNLFIIPVKYIDNYDFSDPHQFYEYQYNILLSYAGSHSLDILLVCLGNISSVNDRANSILQGLGDVPIILICSDMEGYSSVCYANYSGLVDGIEHLISQEHRQKIGMVTGYTVNKDSSERLDTYKMVLSAHGMPVNEDLILLSYFDEKCKEDFIRFWEKNPDMDAIVCGNDHIANAVYQILEERGIEIGKDVSIIGFDDSPFSKYLNPPLATVRANASELGYRAVMQGHRKLSAGTVKEQENFYVDTKFIYRESIGNNCMAKILLQKQMDEQDKLIEKIQQAERGQQMLKINHNMNNFSRDMLSLADESEESFVHIMQSLTEAYIQNCFLFTLKEPVAYNNDNEWQTPKQVYLRACLNNGRAFIPRKSSQTMSIEEIYRHPYMTDDRRSYVMIDLYSRELQYGFLLCDIPYENLHYIEFLCYQISNAIKIMHLFSAQRELLATQEEMVNRLQKENLVLDSISGKDELTGVLNRRGFYKKAESFIEHAKEANQKLLFAYADLNYLKQINDRFGHSEGDFAIVSAASALETVFPGSLTGRIGGDEFAVIAVADSSMSGENIRTAISDELKKRVKESDKPYPLTLSIGIYIQDKADFLLDDAIEAADNLQYEDKKKKPPFIVA